MSQHHLRRSLAALAFATIATLSPFADLHAAPGRQGRSESRDETRARPERRLDLSIWKPLQRLFEKAGIRIDGNGLMFATPAEEESGEKAGIRIDGNG